MADTYNSKYTGAEIDSLLDDVVMLCEQLAGNPDSGITGITRERYSGSGSVTIAVQDQHVYYIDGYSDITVELPSEYFSAHFFVSFPRDALSCSFNLPSGVSVFGDDLTQCDFGEEWEINIDRRGGALALRKGGL